MTAPPPLVLHLDTRNRLVAVEFLDLRLVPKSCPTGGSNGVTVPIRCAATGARRARSLDPCLVVPVRARA